MKSLRFTLLAREQMQGNQSFIDAGRKPKTPGSETKGFIPHDTESSMSFRLTYIPPAPQIPRKQCRKAQVRPVHTVGRCHRTQISHNVLQSLVMSWPWPKRNRQPLWYWTVDKCAVCCRARPYLNLPRLYKHPWKDGSAFDYKICRNVINPGELSLREVHSLL